jgi:F0F1-type ATP synthase assembly protein I
MIEFSTDSMLAVLAEKTEHYSDQEKANISYDYLRNVISKIAVGAITADEVLGEKIGEVVRNLPVKVAGERMKYNRKVLSGISNLKSYIKDKFQLVPKGYHKSVFLPLGIAMGMPLGLPFGQMMGNIALGMPLGIPIGLAIGVGIGSYLDKKAEQENRVI